MDSQAPLYPINLINVSQSIHLFRILGIFVMHFHGLSYMVVDLPCFSVLRSLTSVYAFLLLFLLRHASNPWHWPSNQVFFIIFMSFLIFLLFSLQSLAPSSSSPFSFRSRLWSQQ